MSDNKNVNVGGNLANLSEAECFERGKKWIEESLNVFIEPDARCSSTCFLMVYKRTEPIERKGLKYPDSFRYLRVLSPFEYKELNKLWRSTLLSMVDDTPEKEIANFWLPMLSSAPGKSAIENFVSSLLQLEARHSRSFEAIEGYETGISFNPTGESKPKAFVPQSNWFSEQVQKLKAEDIVTLFPKAELKLLQLFIGRVVCGRDNSRPLDFGDELLAHKFRKMLLVFGSNSGTGKSTFFELLNQSLQLVGYEVLPFKDIGARFGQAETYLSNLAYRDDSTAKSVEDLLKSAELKSLITGSQMQTESKNKAAISVAPQTALLLITNQLSYHSLYAIDSGVLDRLAILYTRNLAELRGIRDLPTEAKPGYPFVKDLPDYRSFFYLDALSEALECHKHTLMLYLIRLSCDYFLKVYHAGRLEAEIAELTAQLVFPVSNSGSENLVSTMVLANLLRTDPSKPIEDRLKKLSNKKTFLYYAYQLAWLKASPQAHYSRKLIKQDWINKKKPLSHPWNALRNIAISSLEDFLDQIAKTRDIRGVSLSQNIKESFQSLQSNDGISLAVGPSYFKASFQEYQNPSKYREIAKLATGVQQAMVKDTIHSLSVDEMLSPETPLDLDFASEVGYDQLRLVKIFDAQLEEAKAKGEPVVYDPDCDKL